MRKRERDEKQETPTYHFYAARLEQALALLREVRDCEAVVTTPALLWIRVRDFIKRCES